MCSKIIVPESVCYDEVVDYIATRYNITPEQVIRNFMCQDGIITNQEVPSLILLEDNEMAILRDMGIRPSCVEFTKTTNL